ncbi:hypothetical protein GCM10019059_40110 [Camelimonas fluminis]|nr:hypothetical protein GCM10019059_40110 [Camelimonas fluminis]
MHVWGGGCQAALLPMWPSSEKETRQREENVCPMRAGVVSDLWLHLQAGSVNGCYWGMLRYSVFSPDGGLFQAQEILKNQPLIGSIFC